MAWGIKCRPIKPGSPHLNGKVERSQKTDLEEFTQPLISRAGISRLASTNGNTITTGNVRMGL